MSKEIKFRAWVIDEKRMINWDSILDFAKTIETIHYSNDKLSNYALMLYTGLKDKNGKEIYEGDIVFNPNDGNKQYQIFWSYRHGCWCLGDEDSYPLSKYCLNEFWEVIGNTYEDNL